MVYRARPGKGRKDGRAGASDIYIYIKNRRTCSSIYTSSKVHIDCFVLKSLPIYSLQQMMHLITYLIVTLVACASSATAQALPPSDYVPPAKNFTQKLNHGSNDNSTFRQLYQINSTFFKPGGPILFIQGEENTLSPISSRVFMDYAPKVGGVVATLEHRFFGTSFPEGSTWNNITTEAYAPLTLDNVLQDSVEFVNWIRKTVPGAENSPVIYTAGEHAQSIGQAQGQMLTF